LTLFRGIDARPDVTDLEVLMHELERNSVHASHKLRKLAVVLRAAGEDWIVLEYQDDLKFLGRVRLTSISFRL